MHSEDGRLVKIEEDRTDPRVDAVLPRTKGCLRLAGAKEYIYHPDRDRFPEIERGAILMELCVGNSIERLI